MTIRPLLSAPAAIESSTVVAEPYLNRYAFAMSALRAAKSKVAEPYLNGYGSDVDRGAV